MPKPLRAMPTSDCRCLAARMIVTTIAIGQPDVADQSVRTFVLKKFDRGLDAFGRKNFVALFTQSAARTRSV